MVIGTGPRQLNHGLPTLPGGTVDSRSSPHDPRPLQVGIDATSLLGPLTGIGVFTRELLEGLAARPGVEVQAFAVSLRGRHGLASAVPAGVASGVRPVPARLARWAWQRGDRPHVADLLGKPVEVVHGPNFVVPPGGGAAEVVTVHDLTAVRFPELCTADVLAWPALLGRAIQRGAWIHTVSGFVADEVAHHFPAVADRVVVVPNGVRPPPPPTDRTDEARGRHLAGGERYVLAVGTVEPRKDLPGLVRAFDLVADGDADLRLVLAGPDGWGAHALTVAIDGARHRRRIVRLGWVDDASRLALLRGATVVAYPSRYEGFGLVPLDAMAAGTPVVATAAGAVPEVVGDAARLVPVGDHEALAGALVEVAADPTVAEALVAAGRRRIERFRWSDTVDGMVDLYEQAVAARGRRSR